MNVLGIILYPLAWPLLKLSERIEQKWWETECAQWSMSLEEGEKWEIIKVQAPAS